MGSIDWIITLLPFTGGILFLFHRSKSSGMPQRPVSRVICATPFFICTALVIVAFHSPVGSETRITSVILSFVMFILGGSLAGWLSSILDQWKGSKSDWSDFRLWLFFYICKHHSSSHYYLAYV